MKISRVLVAVLSLLLFDVQRSAHAQMSIVPDTTRAIYVTGRGAVVSAPDMATVRLGVFAMSPDLPKVKATVDGVVTRIVRLASDIPVAPKDITTSSIYVAPQYAGDDPSMFRGYEVTQSVTVTLRDLTKLQHLLDGAIAAGANRDFDVDVASSREHELKREAMARAIEDAKEQARFVAERLGLEVGPVRSASLNKSFTTTASAATYSAAAATFLPADVKIDAELSVTFYVSDRSSQTERSTNR
jgi:uncharacterized protein